VPIQRESGGIRTGDGLDFWLRAQLLLKPNSPDFGAELNACFVEHSRCDRSNDRIYIIRRSPLIDLNEVGVLWGNLSGANPEAFEPKAVKKLS
jgi:hypothetical protein